MGHGARVPVLSLTPGERLDGLEVLLDVCASELAPGALGALAARCGLLVTSASQQAWEGTLGPTPRGAFSMAAQQVIRRWRGEAFSGLTLAERTARVLRALDLAQTPRVWRSNEAAVFGGLVASQERVALRPRQIPAGDIAGLRGYDIELEGGPSPAKLRLSSRSRTRRTSPMPPRPMKPRC